MRKILLLTGLVLFLFSSEVFSQNSPFFIWGTGLDGSTYQTTAIYSQSPSGLTIEAPKDALGNKLPIKFNWRGGGDSPFVIDGNGNIGIGTVSDAQSKFTIKGSSLPYPNHKALYIQTEGESSTYRDQVMIYSNLNTGYGIAFAGQGHHRAGIYAENSGGTENIEGRLTLWSRNNGAIILKAGKVGIGTSTPTLGRVQINQTDNTSSSGLTIFNNIYSLRLWTDNNGARIDANSAGTQKIIFNGSGTGNVCIGTLNDNGYKLAVEGTIGAREIKVEAGVWSDFVFNNEYQLMNLEEVEGFIERYNHLPDIPSEKEVLENGIQLGEMNAKLLQKIEELTLYMIEVNKEVKALKSENIVLKEKMKKLEIRE